MLIAQISDTHILAHGSDHPAADSRAECLRRCVADINQQRPDAVVFTGDTVQFGQPEEYARLRKLLQPLEPPIYLIPGNRDDNAVLRSAIGEQCHLPGTGDFLHYVIEDQAVRLVALDSTAPGERKGVFCPARQAWLDEVLGEQPVRPTLLFIHHPPFDVGDHYVGGYRRPDEAAALADLVRDHSQIVGLLCGHVHWLIERQWAGRPARIMPSIAVDLRKGIDETEAGGNPVYLLHRVSDRDGLTSQVRRVDSAA